jgi:SAM-dependent methyltransferase
VRSRRALHSEQASTRAREPSERGQAAGPGSRGKRAEADPWDAYADFYDWENLRTIGRRDVPFWERLALREGGPALELGCGSGRVLVPVARRGVRIVGVDRSGSMLARARRRVRRSRPLRVPGLVRGDIRRLPFACSFRLVIAPYGVLQSLLRERDLADTLAAVARICRPGALFAIDLVPELIDWKEYRRRVSLAGSRAGGRSHVTLVETVHQDRARGITRFDQEYIERRGRVRTVRRFTLSFRTVPVRGMIRRLESAGFRIESVFGDYEGQPWRRGADAWIILARLGAG